MWGTVILAAKACTSPWSARVIVDGVASLSVELPLFLISIITLYNMPDDKCEYLNADIYRDIVFAFEISSIFTLLQSVLHCGRWCVIGSLIKNDEDCCAIATVLHILVAITSIGVFLYTKYVTCIV